MIVLDTNVVSELMRASPHPGVLAWVDDQEARSVAISAITSAELAVGVTQFPALDAQIAAICLARGAALAIRNTRDFEGVGVDVVDPGRCERADA